MQDLNTPPGSATMTARESVYDPSHNPQKEEEEGLERTPTRIKEIWKFRLRPADDNDPQ